MGRVSSSKGDDVLTKVNQLEADYVSQTDTTDQDIASNTVYASGKRPIYDGSPGIVEKGSATGTSPITKAHSQGGNITGVLVTPKAVQAYGFSVNWDASNIYIYHDAAFALTFTYFIFV